MQPLSSVSRSVEQSSSGRSKRGGLSIRRLFTTPGNDPLEEVACEQRTSRIKNPDGSIVSEMEGVEVPVEWSQMATDIMVSKYFRRAGIPQSDARGELIRDAEGNLVMGPEQSVKQVIRRLAGCWRHWGQQEGYFETAQDAQAFEDDLSYMLIHQMAAPNSPQWFNTGLNYAYGITGPAQGHYYADPKTGEVHESTDAYTHPQPHACFILSVKDDMVNPGGIMDLWVREARLFKYGSGTGSNFSKLRAAGEPLSGGGMSSGLMSFLKIGDRAAGAVKSGGTTRRAAKMVCLDLDHPDILEFIEWKSKEEKKVAALADAGYSTDFNDEAYQTVSGQNSNNSVRVPHRFFQAVEEDGEWPLFWRTELKRAEAEGRKPQSCRSLRARELWEKIGFAAWVCADPGVQYDTTINDWHTCPADGRIAASNPCSEYMFLDNTACNLASINLLKFYNEETQRLDVEAFRHAVRLWTIVLEISVLMAQFPSREIAELSYRYRTLGLGHANLGALLMRMGIPYDAPAARAFAAGVTAILTGEAYAVSAEMSDKLGPFEGFARNREHMLRVIRNHRRAAYDAPAREYEGLHVLPVGIDQKLALPELLTVAKECWDRALALGEEHGYRNAQVTVIAPTGTIGLLMDCDTTGIEPDFALVKFKKLAGGGSMKIVNQSMPSALQILGYTDVQIRDIMRWVLGTLSLEGAPYINRESLKRKGFLDEDIAKVEKGLRQAFDLRSAFSNWAIGPEVLTRVGFPPKRADEPGFDLLSALGFTDQQIEEANSVVCGRMTVEGAPHLKPEHLPVFDCASRCGKYGQRLISVEGHIRMMAAIQPFITGAISKTINLPNEATVEDIKNAYLLSWKLGLKANALYRDGCKLSQPLAAVSRKAKQAEAEPAVQREVLERIVVKEVPRRRKLPDERPSLTHKFSVAGHEGYLHVGLYEDGKPGEIFIKMAKEGSTLSGVMDTLALSLSMNLQYGVPLEVLCDKLVRTRFEPMGMTTNKEIPMVKSLMDYLGRWLALKFLSKDSAMRFHNHELVEQAYREGSKSKDAFAMSLPIVDEGAPARTDPQHGSGGQAVGFASVSHTALEEEDLSRFTPPVSSHIETARQQGFTGSVCSGCGGVRVKRNGSCEVCLDCGATSGCS
ncbi:MAG TPA: vitamin B12-dependent ribonucleotide reductase [Candidatus Peribacter riflensis]|uniref:Vitamin B12-dependent ribonucleotide reductase n=1 Tax=Candidatus Peribacter riflensis TaxID=1735162 RepID=A0A0S1SNG5_9BACT|nr:MAG: ribonucleoside-diphosphate reductase [Candidatus Peribacter riflensis]OGJ82989.1 MAG: ribonucleoside-diphosphate reductase, adenosylcobalamin-dependent [Candidatus Peribacteria bacterium RIFOXYC1_FULL_58_8]ALM10761.1 MAG: ribonucleoside-diphosphate reductase alpha chain [Candidatus Peribacter riflensis]ALM11863.1 MAG: ribonucleoside-diphosphate reductase alpha chain [Candidatus Peribacter riflensis]ALM12966.1 MAG: ribonucleoside-diphosphate reductase [Candidatus Peribacter riflensis]